MSDSISQAIEAIYEIVPNRPGDNRNDPLVRRLEVLIGAAAAIARAFPDNRDVSMAAGLDLTVQARTLAHLVDTRTQWCLPPGYNLPRCSEAALEASGND
jgi:hypothetical protein